MTVSTRPDSPPFAVTSLVRAFQVSLAVTGLLAGTALVGLLFASAVYPTEELRNALLPNDAVTLFLVVPALAGSMLLARRGSLVGLLMWPGALLIGLYGSVALVVATPLPVLRVAFLALAAACGWAIVIVLRAIDHQGVRQRLAGRVPVRLGAFVLIVFGALFIVRAGAEVLAASGGEARTAAEVGTAVADLVTSPLLVLGGLWLWRRRAVGYGVGTGLLLQTAMLFVALLVFFAVQPMLTDEPFAATDFIVVATIGLACFIPCGMFVRGVLLAGRDRTTPAEA